MLTEHKTMEVPRHVLRTLFRDTKFPLIQHHLDSYNDFLDKQIPTLIQVSNPHQLILPGRGGEEPRYIRVYIGGRDGTRVRYLPPTEYDGLAVLPHTCRLDNRTYALELRADIEIEYTFEDKTTAVKEFSNILIGEIPLMLRSNKCYLSGLDGYKVGECNFELGGYFIIDGAEKVLLTQELLGDNMFYAGTRTRRVRKDERKSLIQQDKPIGTLAAAEPDEDIETEELTETYAAIKTISEDGSRGPYYQFLTLPSPTVLAQGVPLEEMSGNVGRDNRLVLIQIPEFRQPVPLFSVFRALGCCSDRDIYETTLAGVPDKDRLAYDETFRQIILSHDKYLRVQGTTDLEVLQMFTGSKSVSEVLTNIHTLLFSNVEFEDPDDVGSMMRRKSYMLGHMLKMAMDVELGRQKPSDRDNMQFKRFTASGTLCFEEFRNRYREIADRMILEMDRSIQYNPTTYSGTNLPALIEDVNTYWKHHMMLNGFVSSFKGAWGGRVGVGQILARPSYLAAFIICVEVCCRLIEPSAQRLLDDCLPRSSESCAQWIRPMGPTLGTRNLSRCLRRFRRRSLWKPSRLNCGQRVSSARPPTFIPRLGHPNGPRCISIPIW